MQLMRTHIKFHGPNHLGGCGPKVGPEGYSGSQTGHSTIAAAGQSMQQTSTILPHDGPDHLGFYSLQPAHSPTAAAAVGISGTVWPFLINPIDGAGLDDAPAGRSVPAPYMDVHGTRDSRVYPFLATMTHSYFSHLGAQPAANVLSWVPGGHHVPWGDENKAVQRPFVLAFLVGNMRLQGLRCPPL